MNHAAATPRGLADLLAEELRCCRRMVALAAAQRDAMLAGDVAALAPAVREMEGLAAVLARLEEERAAHAAILTPPCGHPSPACGRSPAEHGPRALGRGAGSEGRAAAVCHPLSTQHSALSTRGEVPAGEGKGWHEGQTKADRVRVEELRAALRETLAELRALNDANAALARRALTSTEQALRLLHAALPSTYAADGALHPDSRGVRQTWTV